VIPELQSTIEKPLTAIDYVAALSECDGILEVQIFVERAPLSIQRDERFASAVAKLIKAMRGVRHGYV
jgi:hypothetical protein